MPRYFFDAQNGEMFRDSDGTSLATAADARLEAVKLLASILRSDPEAFCESGHLSIQVRNDEGVVMSQLEVNSLEIPAALHAGGGRRSSAPTWWRSTGLDVAILAAALMIGASVVLSARRGGGHPAATLWNFASRPLGSPLSR